MQGQGWSIGFIKNSTETPPRTVLAGGVLVSFVAACAAGLSLYINIQNMIQSIQVITKVAYVHTVSVG